MSETTVNYVCPACQSVNRVPEDRTTDHPICGNCKSQLIPSHPVELTDVSFSKFISRSGSVIIVDFWAPWCGPCRMMAPAFAEAAEGLSPRIILAKLNTDEAQQSASRFNITGIPCLIAFRAGREIARQSGVMDKQSIIQWAKSV